MKEKEIKMCWENEKANREKKWHTKWKKKKNWWEENKIRKKQEKLEWDKN